jgi:hypothetical protein
MSSTSAYARRFTYAIPAKKLIDPWHERWLGSTQTASLRAKEFRILHLPKMLVWLVALLTSVALLAQGTGTAVLYGTGSVYLNGAQVSNSSAVAAGDVIQTKETGAANVNAPGSSVVIESNSIVRYQPEGFSLDRGIISVATGKAVSVFTRDFKITPVSGGWTEFYVTRTNGSIGIIARKGPIAVSCAANSVTVKEGQQISRDDAANCGLISKGNGAPAAAKGPIITPDRAELGAIGAGGILVGWALIHSDNPVSPAIP